MWTGRGTDFYLYARPLSSRPGRAAFLGQQLAHHQFTDDEMLARAAKEIQLIEQEIVVLSQLQVINVQRLRDFDGLVIRWDSSGIRAVRSAECDTIVVEHELMRKMGLPAFEGGFDIDSPMFKTWLHLKILIDIDTPLIDPDRPGPPVDNYGDAIDILKLPIRRPHPLDLRVVCRSVERVLIPCIDRVIDKHADNKYAFHNEARKLTQDHVDGLVSYLLLQHTKLAALKEDCDDIILV